jgi:threonine dehydratase
MIEYVRPTTLLRSSGLSDILGAEVLLATETFQETGSFKFRAAMNVVAHVPHPVILAASSGNFGQALARACQLAGRQCTVVMPDTSAAVKIAAVESYGATVDLIDTQKISRADRIDQLKLQHPQAYVASAYDDMYVIEGNATLGAELARLDPFPDVFLLPIGGGGLASGVITGLRAAGKEAEIVGAEPLLANDAARSLRAGHIVRNDQEPATLADGARTVSVGNLNWPILQQGLTGGIVEVPEEEIRAGVRVLYSKANLKAEPTGALSVGALLTQPERFQGRRVCCIISGGNVDPDLYARLITSPGDPF